MELGRARRRSRPTESTPGHAVIPGRLLLDVVRSLPTEQVSLEYRSAQQDVEVVAGPVASSTCARCRPRTSRSCPRRPAEGGMTVPAGAFVDTIARVARAASRDETRPHLTGVLVTANGSELRMVATDSYRLAVKETQLEDAAGGVARGERSGPNAPGAGPHRRRRRRRQHRRRRAREPGRVHGRRRGAVVAPGRGSLPELPAAAARVVRARAAREPRRAAGGRAPRRPAGAEERAAAAALLGGRARRLGADTRRGRGERVPARAVRRRTVGDRLQPGVLPRGAGERRVGGADPEADQPAAARA